MTQELSWYKIDNLDEKGLGKDWKCSIKDMLNEMIKEEELPEESLFLSTNYSKDGKTITSYSVCIYEPDFPVNPNKKSIPSKNALVLNIKENGFMLELIIGESRVDSVGIPNDAVIKNNKSDEKNKHILIPNNSPELVKYIKANTMHAYMNYTSKESAFGCCDCFIKCSDVKKCIHENKLFSRACMYRRNLEAGKIFYGKNKTI